MTPEQLKAHERAMAMLTPDQREMIRREVIAARAANPEYQRLLAERAAVIEQCRVEAMAAGMTETEWALIEAGTRRSTEDLLTDCGFERYAPHGWHKPVTP